MKDKSISIILPLSIITVGLVLNFSEFLMGSPATIKNLIVTFVYLATWIFVLIINRNRRIMKYYSVFWIITFFFAIITGYVNVTEVNINWAIPFVIMFLTQWYGINFFVGSYLTTSIIIVSISLIMFIVTILAKR